MVSKKHQSLLIPSNIPEAITYLEREIRGEVNGRGQKIREVQELYIHPSEILHQHLLKLVKKWGDSPAVRQIIFYHYLQREPLLKEIILNCIYPGFRQNRFWWKENELGFYLNQFGLAKSDQIVICKYLEKALREVKISLQKGSERFLDYQRPTVEAVAYAIYAEYGDGFPEARGFALKNPPLEQIIKKAAFPAFFFIDPRTLPLLLETCRLKNYLTLESRGGLNQYALIYQDLSGLVEFMIGGGS